MLRLPGSRRRSEPLTRKPGRRPRSPASRRSRSPAEPVRLLPHLVGGDLARHPEAHHQRRGQGAGPQSPLLPAAGEQRLEADARAAAHVQRADPLRAIQFMGTERGEIDTGGVERHLAERLGGIRVEQGAGRVRHGGERRQVLQHARLVIGRHDADQHGRLRERRGQHHRVQHPVPVHREDHRVEAFAAQLRHAVQHALVLGRHRDHPAPVGALAGGEAGRALDGDVVPPPSRRT